jgi:hypothetical protein
MAYLFMGLVSILIGGAVYLATVHGATGLTSAIGFGDEERLASRDPAADGDSDGDAATPGYTYLQISTQGPAVQDRVVGALVLVLLIGISATVLAFAIYEAGHLINQTIQAFLE